MERSRFVPKFCEKLTELLSKLEDRFPEEKDFGFLYTALLLALKAGKQERVVREYHKFVFQYRDAIDRRDIDFLMKNDYDSVIGTLTQDSQYGRLKVDHFRKLFRSKNVTEQDKEVTWTYLKLLNKLMDGIIAAREIDF